MDKRGSALIFGLLVVMVLAIISSSYFYKAISETSMTRRHIDSTRAFWTAEAGLAEAIKNMPATTSGTLAAGQTYSTVTNHLNANYYQITATGTVNTGGAALSRTVSAVATTVLLDPTKFKYAIETTVKLVVKGSVDINPPESQKEYSTINFADLFSFTKEDVKAYATIYNAIPEAMSGVVWLAPPAGAPSNYSWDFTSNLVGSGILVIEGDIHIAGTINWDGIVYVMGKLRMSGTPIISGTVLAESGITVDDTTMTGNVTLNYDLQKIADALNLLSFASAKIVSWKEL